MSRSLIDKADYLLSKETGTVFKDPGGRVSVCLVYPNTYHVGMSNLGFQGVYTLLNEREDTLCERAFFPGAEDLGEHERTGTGIFALESKRPLGRFDIVAFSVSFENDYPNILKVLELSGIPLESDGRDERHPLIIMGGVCAFANPEPLAPFMDACFVGEAEEMLGEFMDAYSEARERGDTREGFLKKAMRIEGVYIPSFYEVSYEGPGGAISSRRSLYGAPERMKRRHFKDISGRPLRASITTPETEFSGMRLIEAMRGCPWNCRFCLAGHVYGPPRAKGVAAISAEIEDALRQTQRVGLVGPSLTDYRHMKEVLAIDGVDFSITSLRASPGSAEVAGLLKGHKSISIAPEAGTARLREAINKKITKDDILRTAGLLSEHGIQRLRLYFMVGLPSETDEDVEGIVKLVTDIRQKHFTKGNISLTLSTFVPKPFTPFERFPMEDMKTVKARFGHVKKALQRLKGVGVFHDVPKYAYMQGLFALGDRRVGAVLREMLKEADWKKASARAGVDPDFFIRRRKPEAEHLAWDFIGE